MIKERLYIIGAGGYGREIFNYLQYSSLKHHEFSGFIDDNLKALDRFEYDQAVVGAINTFPFRPDDHVIVAVANIEHKVSIAERLGHKVKFSNFIAQDVMIPKSARLGRGIILCPGVKIGPDTKIGNYVSVNLNSTIGHDVILGDFCSIMPNVDVGGGCEIDPKVYMGTKATVAPNLKICENSFLGVGSINIKDTKEAGIYFGNPARRTR